MSESGASTTRYEPFLNMGFAGNYGGESGRSDTNRRIPPQSVEENLEDRKASDRNLT
ncbi:MAG: hypothetical protein ACLQU3_15520 [Limisphaerales bacterium]